MSAQLPSGTNSCWAHNANACGCQVLPSSSGQDRTGSISPDALRFTQYDVPSGTSRFFQSPAGGKTCRRPADPFEDQSPTEILVLSDPMGAHFVLGMRGNPRFPHLNTTGIIKTGAIWTVVVPALGFLSCVESSMIRGRPLVISWSTSYLTLAISTIDHSWLIAWCFMLIQEG